MYQCDHTSSETVYINTVKSLSSMISLSFVNKKQMMNANVQQIRNTMRHTDHKNQNRHRGMKDLLVRLFGQMGRWYLCPLRRKPRRCFSSESRCERQWEGLYIWLNNLQSTIKRYSDTSHGQTELQSTNRRAFLKKTSILFICWLLTKPPEAGKAWDILLTIKATNITCSLLSGIPSLWRSLIRHMNK